VQYKKEVKLNNGERIDSLERNGYGIIQNKDKFCFGMDAVLLSGFATVKKGGTAVDLCTGNGIIPILLEAKTEGSRFFGIEIQSEVCDMAKRSVELNDLSDKITIINEDINKIEKRTFGKVDIVTANPPYMKEFHGLKNPDDAKAIARHEIFCTLDDVCRVASELLPDGGKFYMVHRPSRLSEIISTLKNHRLEPKRVKPVYPYIDKEANMILIEAVKGAGVELKFEKPVIVYKEPGKYTDEIYEIYGY